MKEALVALMGGLGVVGSQDKAVAVEVFRSQHRTIQQCFVRVVVMPILEHLAEKHAQGNFDLRNQASCELAAKMLAAVPEDDRYLPFV